MFDKRGMRLYNEIAKAIQVALEARVVARIGGRDDKCRKSMLKITSLWTVL